MLLRELLGSTPIYKIKGSSQRVIRGLAMELKSVGSDYLYIYMGDSEDLSYEDHIKKAVELGAVAICIGKEDEMLDLDVTFVRTYNVKRFLSAVTRNYYRNPSQGIDLIGITGSHGKTTTGNMIHSILEVAGIPMVTIDRTSCQIGDNPPYRHTDCLNPMVFTKVLKEALDKGIRRGIVECSYTTIREERLRHLWFDSLIYTDLYTYFQNREKDYHYLQIRKTLIDHLKHRKCPIIVNMDDYYARQLESKLIYGYGIFDDQTIVADDLVLYPDRSHFTIHTPKGSANIDLGLPGLHNIYNAMAAIGWCVVEDIEFEHIKRGIQRLEAFTHLKEGIDITGKISIQIHKFASPNEIPTMIENLHGACEYDEKVIILSVPDCEDESISRDIGRVLDESGRHCILTSDYKDRYIYIDSAKAIGKYINKSTLHYEMDRYKALKKSRSFTKDGGSIVIMTPRN
ncbi:MAG: hypothetical protein GX974_09545 [Clostridiales bacterium]|nr:hypothetical protein [Clostridiales bacterium]